MTTTTKPSLALTASDLMGRDIVTIPQDVSLRSAARVLFQNQAEVAPVVDADGRCIGVLSATGFVRWVAEGARGADDIPLGCPYQVKGRLLSGEEAVICTSAAGGCHFQEMRPTTGGRHTAVCLLPGGALSPRRQPTDNMPTGGVRRYMDAECVTVGEEATLSELARATSHAHRLIVLDEQHRPVGVVSSTDVLAALAHSDGSSELGEGS